MQPSISKQHTGSSKLAITSCIFLLTSTAPLTINVVTGNFINKLIHETQNQFFAVLPVGWLVASLFTSIILAIIDLIKTKKTKTLAKIVLIISSVILGLFLLMFSTLLFTPGQPSSTPPQL